MRLRNTETGLVQPLEPAYSPVRVYVCGITPYDTTHLGHAFTFATFDVLVRALRAAGCLTEAIECYGLAASLSPREERVVRMRFGIGMSGDHTLSEVGQQFSVSRERIRQIEAKALRKLKHPHRSRILRSFIDN